MINRPITRIELKLEEDLREYQEMQEIKRKNLENANLYRNQKFNQFNLSDENYTVKKKNISRFSPFLNDNISQIGNRNQINGDDNVIISRNNYRERGLDN